VVVFVRPPIFFQNIDANRQIIAATIFSDNGSPLFRPQLTDATGPFFLVLGQILEFFSCYLLADVLAEVFDDFFRYGYVFLSDFVQHIPTVRGLAVLVTSPFLAYKPAGVGT